MISPKFLIFLLVFGMFSSIAYATHIVGGEFQFKHLADEQYQLSLFLYNDDLNGNPRAIDDTVEVFMWAKGNTKLIASFLLLKYQQNNFLHQPVGCNKMPIQVSRVEYRYAGDFSFNTYSNEAGYYFTYERCCRNGGISNIQNPGDTGQAFYLEVPTFGSKRSGPYINSSPVLPNFPVEYLKINQVWEYDLTATDTDGDELKYALEVPLAGNSSRDFPVPEEPKPAPYAPIRWLSGYSRTNQILGGPALYIDGATLRVKPNRTGLYVVAVKVEEFRNGIKIGEVRREFQVVVYAPENQAPTLSVSQNGVVLTGAEPVVIVKVGQPLELQIEANDPEGDPLRLTGQGRNFQFSAYNIEFVEGQGNGNIARTLIWEPTCELFDGETDPELYITFFAQDENLCQNKSEVQQAIVLKIIQKVNTEPQLSGNLGYGAERGQLRAELFVGESLQLDLTGYDGDPADLITLTLEEASMAANWPEISGNSFVAGQFNLEASCEMLEGKAEKELIILFLLKDDGCPKQVADSLRLRVLVKQPIQNFTDVVFPNMFSPNGDNFNEEFYIKDLPEDVCTNQFEYIRIYNRWGKTVFYSQNRNFSWAGHNYPDGVYYYELKYRNWQYQSFLSLMRGNGGTVATQSQ